MTYLESTYFYELEHSLVEDLISEFQNKGLTDKEKAIGLYLKVRDGWLYNPYLIACTHSFGKGQKSYCCRTIG
jgi:hypothetical protein